MDIEGLLKETALKSGSDLHLTAGQKPIIRIDGDLKTMDHAPLDSQALVKQITDIIDVQKNEQFHEGHDVDFAYEIPNTARFRINVYQTDRGPSAAFRVLPNAIPSFQTLNFSSVHRRLCNLPNGLILVTGPTGSGKSTTLASMINFINENQQKHIITVEDPIEYRYDNKKCLVHQRELGHHTESFNNALRSALRQDPDILLVGEMRDLDTIRLALTAAETGHLVFATLHTRSAPQTVSRIIDVFPSGEKHMVQTMLSNTIQAVLGQVLLKKTSGGRLAAQEIMLGTPAIRNLIRENKVAQMEAAIQTGKASGMQTLAQHKRELSSKGLISMTFQEEDSF